MDLSNCIRIVHDKIQNFEPELASKIVGCILMNNGEEDIIRLASCPDQFIREAASKAIQMLSVNPTLVSTMDNPLRRFSRLSPRTPTSSSSFQAPSPYWDPQSVSLANPEYMATNYLDSITELQNQAHLLSLENHHINHVNTGTRGTVNDFNGLGASPVDFGGKTGRRFSSSSEFPLKVCHYFNKGYCRNGLNCRYSHAQILAESFSQMHGNDAANEDQVISPGSLAQLESEIIELLKQRKGNPMSIASLPGIYYEKYKKGLQADGYLTESQRHGRTGYSLTRLLVRLPSIRLIDRPHGQHAVVLAEDAHKYIQKGDSAQHISASRQIYLTFPADSTFSEDDVADYFNTFGSVADVRIPCQQKRMFGFVTFNDPEPVKVILDKGNPHYVRGSRVLVKPYREKVKVIERKYQDRIEPSVCCSHHHHYDIDCKLNSVPSHVSQSSLRRQLIEEHQQQATALEFHRRRLAQLQQITRRPVPMLPPIGVSMDEFRASNDHFNFQLTESSSSAPLNGNSSTDSSNGNSNEGFNLLDSSFAFPIQSDFLSGDLVSQTHKREI